MIVGMIAAVVFGVIRWREARLEHAVISDGKENHYEHRAHREKRVLEHPVERRFKNIATGELEPFAKSISQIHGGISPEFYHNTKLEMFNTDTTLKKSTMVAKVAQKNGLNCMVTG
jgi:hypothetical protein